MEYDPNSLDNLEGRESSHTSPLNVVASPTLSESAPVFRYNRRAFIITGSALAAIVVIGISTLLLLSKHGTKASSGQTAGDFAQSSLSLNDVKASTLPLGQADNLTINGALTINNSFVLSPIEAPDKPVLGQLYFDKTSNAPFYYNGSKFVSLAPSANNSLQGSSATNLTVVNNSVGVISLTGTANQVNVSGNTGSVALSLPQDIAPASRPAFAGMRIHPLSDGANVFQVTDSLGGNLLNVDSTTKAVSVSDLVPQTAGVIQAGIETNSVVSVNTPNAFYNDGAHSGARGPDGFMRVVYHDGIARGDLKYVRCNDNDCSSPVITTVAIEEAKGIDEVSVAIAPDGFARIAYITWTDGVTDPAVHYIVCQNADCTSKTDTTVITDTGIWWPLSMVLDNNGLASMLYESWDGATDSQIYVRCTNADCSAHTQQSVASINSGGGLEYSDLIIGADNFARILISDELNGQLKYVTCANVSCSSSSSTVLTSITVTTYYESIRFGSDGFPRIVYQTDHGVSFIQCTDANCSSPIVTPLLSTGEKWPTVQLEIGSDGLPRMYIEDDGDHSVFIKCGNQSCLSRDSVKITDAYSYPNSFAISPADKPMIMYYDATDHDLKYVTFLTANGHEDATGTIIGSPASPFGTINAIRANLSAIDIQGSSAMPLQISSVSGTELASIDSTGLLKIQSINAADSLIVSNGASITKKITTVGTDAPRIATLGQLTFNVNNPTPSYSYGVKGTLRLEGGSNHYTLYESAGTLGRFELVDGADYNYLYGHDPSGVRGEFYMNYTGTTADWAAGISGGIIVNNGAALDNGVGLMVQYPDTSGAGLINKAYGIDIKPQKVGTVLTGYGIYQEGINDLNYLGGKLAIGTTPGNALLTVGIDGAVAPYNGIQFGTDTDLYRSGGNQLKTDGSMIVGGNFNAGESHFMSPTNSLLAFAVQNNSLQYLLDVDTINNYVYLGNSAAGSTFVNSPGGLHSNSVTLNDSLPFLDFQGGGGNTQRSIIELTASGTRINDIGGGVLQFGRNAGATTEFQIGTNGAALFRNNTDTATGFQIQSTTNSNFFVADTSNYVINIAGTTSKFASLTLSNAHVKSTQTTAPTIGTPNSCGASPTAAVKTVGDATNSTDSAGAFRITAGTGSPATCDTVISFNKAYGTAPKTVIVVAETQDGGTGSAAARQVYVSNVSTNGFTVKMNSAPAASEADWFYYWVIE